MTHGPTRSVVFIHPSDELYGADRMLLELVAALPENVTAQVWLPDDLDHPSSPLCSELARRGVDAQHRPLPILRRAYSSPRALLALLWRTVRTARALRTVRPDVVYCTTSAAYLAVVAARLAGIRIVIGHVQEFWSRSDTLVLRPLARGVDRLIVISPAVARSLPDVLRRRMTTVLNATPEPDQWQPLAGRSGPLHYLVASRWNGWKGHRTLLAAWAAAGCPGVLTVLGDQPPSGEVVDVRALVARLPDPASVRIVGEVTDVGPYIRSADVVVVPSDQPEPFGLVAIEAFAAGRPVLASRAGGLADIVTAGTDGWLFEPSDASDLAALLSRLSRAEVEQAGQAARRSYEERFTTDRYAREWQAALTSLL